MRAQGNGAPSVCLGNLFSMMKSEVAFARDKGIDPDSIDQSANNISILQENIEELSETYEPRINVDDIAVRMNEAGNFEMGIKAGNEEEVTEE